MSCAAMHEAALKLLAGAGIRDSKTSAYSLLFASRIRLTIGTEKFDSDKTSMGDVTT